MSASWMSAVAAAVNERMAAKRIGQQELAGLSGVSVSTLRQVQTFGLARTQRGLAAGVLQESSRQMLLARARQPAGPLPPEIVEAMR